VRRVIPRDCNVQLHELARALAGSRHLASGLHRGAMETGAVQSGESRAD
jgi:hypothetical protein